MRSLIPITGTLAILLVSIGLQRAASQVGERNPLEPPRAGAAITSPNLGPEGTLDILEGGGSSMIWTYDVASNTWQPLGTATGPVASGGALSDLFNSCDFAFLGGASTTFLTTGNGCTPASVLAPAPAPVGPGAALTTAPGLVGSPTDFVFALRGAGTSDFWRYSISQNAWTVLPPTPAPAGDGAALVEVDSSCGPSSGGSQFHVFALRGGNTADFWCFDIAQNVWLTAPSPIPPAPAPVGPGGSLAQLQHLGRIYALRGGGTSDFWVLQSGRWTKLSSTPGPVRAGGGLAAVNYGTDSQRDELFALQGGDSTAIWKYDVASDTWTHVADVPQTRRPVRRR